MISEDIIVWDFDCTISSMHYYKTLHMAKDPIWTERWGGLLLQWWRGKVSEVPSSCMDVEFSYSTEEDTHGPSRFAGANKVPTDYACRRQLQNPQLSESHIDQTPAQDNVTMASKNHGKTDAYGSCNDNNINNKSKECNLDLEVDGTHQEDSDGPYVMHEHIEDRAEGTVEGVDGVEGAKKITHTVEEFENVKIVATSDVARVSSLNITESNDAEVSLGRQTWHNSLESSTSQHHGEENMTGLSEGGEFHQLVPKSTMDVAERLEFYTKGIRSFENDKHFSESEQKPLATARLRAQKRMERLKYLKRLKKRSVTTNLSPQTFKPSQNLENEW